MKTAISIGVEPDGWKESGRWVKRGLYRTVLLNWYINADCDVGCKYT